MPSNPLFHPVSERTRTVAVRDQIQMALAIAEPALLKALLVNCIPEIAELSRIGAIFSQVSVPVGDHQAADGILQFEAIRCLLADPQPQLDLPSNGGWTRESKELSRLTQHESELQTLGHHLALAPAIALLANSGFRPEQIDEILRLPHYAWYKSWWYAIDPISGQFTVPFLRCIRTMHYPDGTHTLQYKDFFEHEKPTCFTSLPEKVLTVIRPEGQGFGDTLRQINYQRERLGIERAVLICNTISELEAQAFIHQGISVYPAIELILPTQADCEHCARRDCPMNGKTDSLVALCLGFLLESEYV
ncbi:MAG: hypothetical protein HC866_22575 [Leptolyngbyaceae cyanobacterium RU_5_1]|nr:hypothetical protein [Leptolyngbyaceae cyanobacterium RU_5_1]